MTQLIVDGVMKRGALLALIAAEALRDVGYGAAEVC